jgi:hypothetical protein
MFTLPEPGQRASLRQRQFGAMQHIDVQLEDGARPVYDKIAAGDSAAMGVCRCAPYSR